MKITIITHPNSKKPRVEKDLFGTLHAYVSAPPLEGKANRAVIESLAEYFKVKKSSVVLLSGEKSKTKLFEIPTLPLPIPEKSILLHTRKPNNARRNWTGEF